MKRRYRLPPILEAVCEIHFELESPFTSEQIALLEPVWKPSYPLIQTNEEKGVQFQIGINGVEVKDQTSGKRLVARSEDGTRLAQLSNGFLAVNQLKPYPGWKESFRAAIHLRLKDVSDHLPIKGVKEINLRYIDRLDFPQVPLKWPDWFSFNLPVPTVIPSIGGKFQFQFERELEGGLVVVFRFAAVDPVKADCSSVMLDTTVFWKGSASLEECTDILERVHKPQSSIFDESLTDQSRDLFGAYSV